jgi:hypothetical protein
MHASALDVVHEALKGTDVQLGYLYSGLEREAQGLAQQWAEKGLPRHDVPRSALTEPEEILARRAQEAFSQWVRTSRRKLKGALDQQLHVAKTSLDRAKRSCDRFTKAVTELETLAPRAARSQSTEGAGEPPASSIEPGLGVGEGAESTTADVRAPDREAIAAYGARREEVVAERTMPLHWSAPLLLLLLLADFVANAPVFTELFPSDRLVDAQVGQWAIGNLERIEFSGLRGVLLRMGVYPEPTLLAFSIIAFFLFLGHVFGGAMKAYTAASVLQRPGLAIPGKRVKSHAVRLMGFSGLGIAVTVLVLFLARNHTEQMATERLHRAELRFAHADSVARLAASNLEDREGIRRARQDRYAALDDREHRLARLDYAQSLATLNVPITLLNIVLVFVAVVVGYKRQVVRIVAEDDHQPEVESTEVPAMSLMWRDRGEAPAVYDEVIGHPEADEGAGGAIQERVAALRGQMQAARRELAEALSEADDALLRAERIVGTDPFSEASGVKERLAGAVTLFRAENARLRGLDPAQVLAFKVPPGIQFDDPKFVVSHDTREALDKLREDWLELRRELGRVESPSRARGERRAALGPSIEPAILPEAALA